MKKVKLSFIDRWSYKMDGKKVRRSMKEWIINFWVVTKENDTSRCVDLRQLIKKISRNGSAPS
jgi:hypothetical protein